LLKQPGMLARPPAEAGDRTDAPGVCLPGKPGCTTLLRLKAQSRKRLERINRKRVSRLSSSGCAAEHLALPIRDQLIENGLPGQTSLLEGGIGCLCLLPSYRSTLPNSPRESASGLLPSRDVYREGMCDRLPRAGAITRIQPPASAMQRDSAALGNGHSAVTSGALDLRPERAVVNGDAMPELKGLPQILAMAAKFAGGVAVQEANIPCSPSPPQPGKATLLG